MKKNLIAVSLVVVLVSCGGFFAGMRYQQSKNPRFGNFGGDRARQFQQRAGSGLRPVNGEIISVDDKSITVKLMDGSSKIIILSSNTTISKAAEAIKEDLKTGEKVAVFGQENSDGSITAANIQLNPIVRGFSNGLRPTVTGQ